MQLPSGSIETNPLTSGNASAAGKYSNWVEKDKTLVDKKFEQDLEVSETGGSFYHCNNTIGR